MKIKEIVVLRIFVVVLAINSCSTLGLFAQTNTSAFQKSVSLNSPKDSTSNINALFLDSISGAIDTTKLGNNTIVKDKRRVIKESEFRVIKSDTLTNEERHKRIESMRKSNEKFLPDPNKSVWYALMLPGAGQIYNRKYWKLPIVYGGFAGVAYAITWNSVKYNEHTQAYLDILDTDPNTNSYLDIVPAGYPESSIESYLSNSITHLRRYRDMSILAGVVFYAVTVVDAFVDAQLADFDISPDLSMQIRPKLEAVPNSVQPAVACQVGFTF